MRQDASSFVPREELWCHNHAVLESLRRASHACLPKAVRDAGWNGLNLAASIRALGVREGRRLIAVANEPATGKVSAFSVYGHPFWIRHGTSDPVVLIQSVFRGAYDAWLPVSPAPGWIFDLGANIGDSAVWFLARYPDARVISIEPEPANYELARRNLEPYGDRVILLHAAVWPSDGEVRVRTVPINPAGAAVGVTGDTACAAVSIPTLMAQYKIPHVGIFKCDIEGAEALLFQPPPSWLAEVDHICIELHDANCRAVVREAARRFGFTERTSREVHVFRRAWT
jgi:FkbM family methyltransferase